MATTVTLKPNAIDISGSTSGTTTLQATAVAGTTTLTLPAATDTLVGKATTDTLTNKTLTGAVMNGTLGATTPSTVAATTISASSTATFAAGAVGTPSITTTGDTNTGIFFPAADTIAFAEGGAEAMRIDSSGNVGIGVTPTAALGALQVATGTNGTAAKLGNGSFVQSFNGDGYYSGSASLDSAGVWTARSTGASIVGATIASGLLFYTNSGLTNGSTFSPTERMRIDTSGNVLVGTTTASVADANGTGASLSSIGNAQFSRASGGVVNVNRKTDDGVLVFFQQDATSEGNISVSGTTVSYNGGHLSRYAQTTTAKDNSLVKGTVLSNLDEMNVYTDAEGNPVENEQLNKVKVSDIEGDANVAGVFVNWDYDETHNVDEINMAMTGDMIIRIAQGVTVQRGDLLMSAGNGTAKPQGDDIVRSKTVAKVTSTHVTCTYPDGSFCVPCVLMAC